MSELPTGTVTFLFTDLESSTRLWEEYPDAMRVALGRHDDILRRAVQAQGGHVVKMTGDGIHAAFATAHSAVETAIEGQLALCAERWGELGHLDQVPRRRAAGSCRVTSTATARTSEVVRSPSRAAS